MRWGWVRARLLAAATSLLLVAGCQTARHPPSAASLVVWSWFDLPATDRRSHELSGIAWDDHSRTAYVVQDNSPTIVTLVPDAAFRSWSFGESIAVNVSGRLDLEAIALLPDGFIVSSEIGPRILELDRRGRLRSEVTLPTELSSARVNKSLESVAVSPDGRYLFTVTEAALPEDGALASARAGTHVRIIRIDRATGAVAEHMYVTDHAEQDGADYGVADLVALSTDELILLERGWSKKRGNSARAYFVRLAKATKKLLVVDLGRLDISAMNLPAAKEPQSSRLLDNYEALALGPRLPDGRASLLVVSDDNARASQVARVLVLALPSTAAPWLAAVH